MKVTRVEVEYLDVGYVLSVTQDYEPGEAIELFDEQQKNNATLAPPAPPCPIVTRSAHRDWPSVMKRIASFGIPVVEVEEPRPTVAERCGATR